MADTIASMLKMVEERSVHVARDPITFDQYVNLNLDGHVELVDGVLVERMVAFLDHQDLEGWLLSVLRAYVRARSLGAVLSSRTAVKVDRYRARLPDILYVRRERLDLVRQDAVYGAPDLIVEIVSPNDRPSDIASLESDYRRLGVPEIWFVDQRLQVVRVVTGTGEDYVARELTEGALRPAGVPGFEIEIAWLFRQPLPNEYAILRSLLQDAPNPE